MKYTTKEELLKNLDSYRQEMSDYSIGRLVKSGFGLAMVNRYLQGDKSGLSILDIASAGGAFAGELSGLGFKNIHGTDIQDFREAASRSLFRDFKTADLNYEALPWSDDYFDAMVAWCVLPHLENPHNLIREAERALKKGGLFFISMPNIFSFTSRWRFFRYGDLPRYKSKNDHIASFPKGVFMKSVLKYFDLVAEEYFVRDDSEYFHSVAWPEKLLLKMKNLLVTRYPKLKSLIGYNIVYVLRKR